MILTYNGSFASRQPCNVKKFSASCVPHDTVPWQLLDIPVKGQYDTHPHSESSHRSPSEQGNTLAKRQSHISDVDQSEKDIRSKKLDIIMQGELRKSLEIETRLSLLYAMIKF